MSKRNNDIQQPFKAHEELHDIFEIHRQALREPPDPSEGLEKPPWWLWLISVLLIFWAGFYMGRYGGVFGPEVQTISGSDRTEVQIPVTKIEKKEPSVNGAGVYARICMACHQSNGQGIPGAFPPLAESELLLGNPEIPIKIVLHGLQGPVTVKGITYHGVMPAWGTQLSDAEIAAVLTYARSNWGNSAPGIENEKVEALRKETSDRTAAFTVDELK